MFKQANGNLFVAHNSSMGTLGSSFSFSHAKVGSDNQHHLCRSINHPVLGFNLEIIHIARLNLVAKSLGILATGAICLESKLAKTPHNIPATWKITFRSRTPGTLDWKLEKYQGVSWTGQQLSPTPVIIVRFHQVSTSVRVQFHWIFRVSKIYAFFFPLLRQAWKVFNACWHFLQSWCSTMHS